MYILGITSFAHESSCSLIKDGCIKAVMEEERFNREKHTWKYPRHAIEHCLAGEGISIYDVDHITFFWNPYKEICGNAAHVLRFFPKSLNLITAPSGGDALTFSVRVAAMSRIGQEIKDHFNLERPPKVHFIEHHLAHAASAFFVSGFKEAAILTVDGRGESTSTMISVGKGNKITKLNQIQVPHSLGHLYAAITDYLGFKPFFDEWKVMGMSAYGKDTFRDVFENMVHFTDDGEYRLNLKYFLFHTHGQSRWVSDFLIKKLGPKRGRNDVYEQRHFDIAFGLQKIVEQAGVQLARGLFKMTGLPNLCLTGGVVLNCLMNKKILEETDFQDFFIQPIANDAGTSLGSALFFYRQILGQNHCERFSSIYLGPAYSNEEIEKVLIKKGIHYKKCADIAKETAFHVAQGKITGWFQGHMEAGPRALGNRSIVGDPRDASMKDRLNARVKKREFFRPFAPSILEEKVEEYFVIPKKQLSPYMILIGDVKEKKRAVIPAVTHADGTARVHTVNKDINPRYWQLIHEFEKITGVPVLLNTSFNENEPIVCTPEDAVNCFLRTDFDVLAIGDFLVIKECQ